MMTDVEKTAQELATRAVERKYMRKTAFELPETARTAIIGSLLGGAGTGAISALSGRRGGSLARDLLLGTLVGGAGGAAYPYITETAEDITGKISGPELTPAERSVKRQKSVAEAVQGTGGPGMESGLTSIRDVLMGAGKGLYGEGSGADTLSFAAPLATGAGVTALSHAREMAQGGKMFQPLKSDMPKWKRWTTRGLRATPGAKSMKYGALTALVTALLERAMRMPTPQGAAQ